METPYRAIKFDQYDTITRDDVNQLGANLQWIHDNTPRGRMYRTVDDAPYAQEIRTVLLCGSVWVGKSKKEATVKRTVSFGKAFDPQCHPNVTTGIVSQGAGNVFCVVSGPNKKPLPDSTGCEIKVTAPDADGKIKKKNWEIAKPILIHWQAFGYRAENENGL